MLVRGTRWAMPTLHLALLSRDPSDDPPALVLRALSRGRDPLDGGSIGGSYGTGIQRRLGIILHHQLDLPGYFIAMQEPSQRQAKVDARGHSAAGDPVAIDHHALSDRLGPQRPQ